MAHLYVRDDSPFFWISYRDANGRRRQVSTGFRHSREYPVEIRKARALELRRSAEELDSLNGKPGRSVGWAWVASWLRTRYSHSPGALARYVAAWKPLALFLAYAKVQEPERFTRQHCFDYIAYRTADPPHAGCLKASHNSALNDVHILGVIMQEALNRRMIQSNPCVRLGIRKHEAKRKPELTWEDIALIRQEIPKVRASLVREMLHASFEIARHQGCRIAETRIHLRNDVDLDRGLITFRTKTRKSHTTALHDAVAVLVKDLIAQGKTYSWEAPADYHPGRWASQRWHLFFKRIGLTAQGKTFHSTRVTVITELARNGVSRSKAMAFVAHSMSATHSIYTRLQPEDLSDCLSAIARPKT